MMNYLEYLNLPTTIAVVIVGAFLVMQIVGEVLEFKGKVVPEFVKVRKIFKRKAAEREIARKNVELLNSVENTLRDLNEHYSDDNIKMRDEWIRNVNDKMTRYDSWASEIDEKLGRNNSDTLSLLVESKRGAIINFASLVADGHAPVTKEQFNRIFRIHTEYESLIEENGLTNGEADVAFRIIQESYEEHMRNHSFIEDIRGYANV